MVLQLIFGMTGTPLSLYLRFGRRVLIKVLKSEPDNAIKVPDDATIRLSKTKKFNKDILP